MYDGVFAFDAGTVVRILYYGAKDRKNDNDGLRNQGIR